MKQILGAAALLATLVFSGCKKNESECNYDPCARVAPASEIASVQAYLNNAGITGAVQHCSGAFYIIVNGGSGGSADACSTVNATYEGRLTNGNVFNATTTTDFSLQQVITGWSNLVPLIREGGRIKMYIPPSLAYGASPRGPIPANSILIFDVTLNSVR